jgi:hypothetical protein
MAGVAGPMLARSRWLGGRFLAGLAVGGIGAGLVLAVPVYLAGSLLGDAVPLPVRLLLLGALAVGFGLADLADRTPHIWRQVPQRLVRSLPAGTLGLVWGFDLGLLFTTQKVVSMLWLGVAGVLLVEPSLAPAALVVFTVVVSTVVSMWSLTPWAVSLARRLDRTWVRRIRRLSGATLVLVGLGTTVAALIG